MFTKQIGTKDEVREKARGALTDYLTMFQPQSWDEPLEKLRILLHSNGDIDWEALKGNALQFFDERRLAEDRVETLARIDRLGEALQEIFEVLSPAEWHKTMDDIILAANFRAHKKSVQMRASSGSGILKEIETESP
jgi:hypothetical protein